MASLWKLGGLDSRALAKRVWNEAQQDDIFGRAAQLSYYFLLSLFPLLIFLTSVMGVVLGTDIGIRQRLFSYLSQVMPPAAFQLIESTMREVSAATSGSKISFGILAALWAASNGMGAVTDALNVAYDVKESRPWWKQRLTAIALTIALSIFILTALGVVLSGGRIADGLAAKYALASVFTLTWKILQWPIVLAAMLFAFAMIYYFAPDVRNQKWVWITPGAVTGVALWLLVSLGFRLYLAHFDSYSKTYGSLGAVIILMLWLFFTGAAVLIGGEVNAEIEHAAAEAGAADAKAKGEKQPSGGSSARAASQNA
jgi:membrane protein